MQLWRTFDEVAVPPAGSAVALGVFDGVHRGHRVLLEQAVYDSRRLGALPVMVTFNPHPVEVIRPGTHPSVLTTLERRAALATEFGTAAVLALPFDSVMAEWSPAEFVDRVLVSALHAVSVSVGSNFTFGRKAEGTAEVLVALAEERGIMCHVLDLVASGGAPLSSTRVRSLLAEGRVADAAQVLGRPHRVSGEVVRGAGRGGRDLGYPTANLDLAEYTAIPSDGVYAGWFTVLDDSPIEGTITPGLAYPCAVSVGTNPTFDGTDRTVEAFVLDESADLYGRVAAVDFVDHVRAMERFDSIEQLLIAMDRDVRTTRQILGIANSG